MLFNNKEELLAHIKRHGCHRDSLIELAETWRDDNEVILLFPALNDTFKRLDDAAYVLVNLLEE